ncbi:protein qua-1-like [Anopheles bellator]|uniref:protein qua-1-like n=1 Tax=Anopheles bellator TaxID=139047 RepID=UPI00264735B6|nr:protein qua-1-like [Anopheles bellator]
MENTSYGINVANRYDLFCIDDDADDPIDSILKNKQKQQKKQQQQQSAAAAAGTGAAAPAAGQQAATVQSKTNAKGEKENKSGGGRGAENRHPDKSATADAKLAQTNGTGNHLHNQRGGGGGAGGERRGIKETQKDNIRNQENQKTGGNQANKLPRSGGPNSKSQTGGGAPGAGANNDDKHPRKARDFESAPDGGAQRKQPYAQNGVKQRFDARGKRELDRQSGSNKTGIKAVDKRDGAGSHNWGSSKQDAKEFSNLQEQDYQPQDADTSGEENKPQTDRNNSTTNGNNNSAAAGEGGETGEPGTTTKAEDEAKEMTLDEWKAQKAAVRLKPQYNLRKAGEGEDAAQWDKMVALNKKSIAADGGTEDDEGNDTQKSTAASASATPATATGNKSNKQVLDIEFHFNDNRRGGLGRGRGGGRGGKGGSRGMGRDGPGGGGGGGRREYGGGDNYHRSGGGEGGGYEHRGPGADSDGGTGGGGGGGERPQRDNRRNNRPPGVGGGGAGGSHYEGGGANKFSRPNPRPPRQHFVAAPKVDDEHDFPSLG